MLSKQEEEQERREVLENDRRVREQQRGGTTFHQYAESTRNDDLGGRFAALGPSSVIGATPILSYPAAAPHQRDPVGTEPPLGYAIDDMPPLESSAVPCVEETGASAGAAHTADNLPPSAESDDTGAPSSPTDGSK
jgi:hypothetical protein